jgi:hypothetical protein
MNVLTYGVVALIILTAAFGFAIYAYRPRIYNLFLSQYLLVRIVKQLLVYGFLVYLVLSIMLAILQMQNLFPEDVLTIPAEDYVTLMQFLSGFILLLFFRNAYQAEERLRQLEIKARDLQYDLRMLTEESVDESLKAKLVLILEEHEVDLSPENGYFFTVLLKHSYWNNIAFSKRKQGGK